MSKITVLTKAKYVSRLTEACKTLGTYREEFDILIENLAQIMHLRDLNMKDWEAAGFKMVAEYTNKASATNLTKSPYFVNNLQYQEQILKYMSALGITPRDAKRIGIEISDEENELDAFDREHED